MEPPDLESVGMEETGTASTRLMRGERSSDAAMEGLETPPTPTPAIHALYVSHFFTTWNSRLFEFGAVLFLANIYPGTLLPLSIYASFRALVVVLVSPVAGRYIDTNERLKVVQLSIVVQRLAVMASCLIFWCLLRRREAFGHLIEMVLFALLVALACAEKLGSTANLIAIERDWVVVIADDNLALLQKINSQIRRIDLFCKLVGPLAIALLDAWSEELAILTTCSLSAVSVIVEYGLTIRVFRRAPLLRERHEADGGDVRTRDTPAGLLSLWKKQSMSAIASVQFWATHRAFLPSLSLSVLFLTVLSFSGQMVTYLLSVGFSPATVGVIRMISTVFELSATWLAPTAMTSIGPIRAGIWFLNWQLVWIAIATAALWTYRYTAHPLLGPTLLVVGIIMSRIGLWGFDLCVQTTIQDSIESAHRGRFSSTEASVQNLFELGAYAATMVWSRPDQFRYPAVMSVGAVCLAAGLYAKFVRDHRGHLLHLCDCWKSGGMDISRHGGVRQVLGHVDESSDHR